MSTSKIRINKELVSLGLVQSRRRADELIGSGQVTINGKIASIGDLVNKTDLIQLSGRKGGHRTDITLILNKPKGYICSHTQQGDTPTIFSILPKKFRTLKIAGRLDKDSQGLVVLSSDGELINKLSHPGSGKLKTYVVDINKPIMASDKRRLSAGVILPDGVSTFINLKTITLQKLRFSLAEGRNKQIRRTLSQIGYKVTKLERISLGDFQLRSIPIGKYRFVDVNTEEK